MQTPKCLIGGGAILLIGERNEIITEYSRVGFRSGSECCL